jgi:hypothetical protein
MNVYKVAICIIKFFLTFITLKSELKYITKIIQI